MENQFKLRMSRMFRSSFGSCKSKSIVNDDVIEKPDDEIQHRRQNTGGHHHHLMELSSPIFRSIICRPRCIVTKKNNNLLPRIIGKVKVMTTPSERRPLLPEYYSHDNSFEGQIKCPPASPASPCNNNNNSSSNFKPKSKKNKNRKSIRKRVPAGGRFNGGGNILEFHHPSTAYNYINGLLSSGTDKEEEEEDDKTTFFSSTRSLSSDSSTSFRRRRRRRSKKSAHKISPPRRPVEAIRKEETLLINHGKVKGSFAVVKRSRDPYSDFRTSMVEMIIEKQIFSGEDLEKLLQCFLSLNSYHHHEVIMQVFTEIWEALFCNLS